MGVVRLELLLPQSFEVDGVGEDDVRSGNLARSHELRDLAARRVSDVLVDGLRGFVGLEGGWEGYSPRLGVCGK